MVAAWWDMLSCLVTIADQSYAEEEVVLPSATAVVTPMEKKPAVIKVVRKAAKKGQLGLDEMLVQRKFVSPSVKVQCAAM